jgi:glycosyltransferase involved in cell wall biosynthesis
MILLDAIFINNSGGRVLLDYLVEKAHSSGLDFYYLLDSRVKGAYPFLPENKVSFLSGSIKLRHSFYKGKESAYQTILCFGNLPPTIKTKAKVFTYFHNVLFAEGTSNFSMKSKLLWMIKRMVFKNLIKNTHFWMVQSEEVKSLMIKKWNLPSDNILIRPFYPELPVGNEEIKLEQDSFLFVSDGNLHKNHTRLLVAFKLLQQVHSQAKLVLTISKNYPQLLGEIEALQKQGLNIENLGIVKRADLYKYYKKYSCLVYPSLKESFGLGLIEASSVQMPIIASNLPYAFAVANPVDTFNPESEESIFESMNWFIKNKPKAITAKAQNTIGTILQELA